MIKYNTKEINKMLFTELVLAYVTTENKEFYNEIVRRLKFCDFEDKMIRELIAYELEILKTTHKTFDDLLINKKWWLADLQKYNKEKLLPLPLEQYILYYQGEISKNALTNSELVSINDEANFIRANRENFQDNIIKEAWKLNASESKTNLRDEFIHRIDYIYQRELGIKYNKEIFNKAMRFFINESHIIFINKYSYEHMDQVSWKPYSNEYYSEHQY